MEGAGHGLHLTFADGCGCLDDFAEGFKAQRVADHILELALGESTRRELLAHKLSIFQGVELSGRLEDRDLLDPVGNLVVRGFDTEFAGLVLKNEEVPDELGQRPILIWRGSAEFLQKLELPEREGELVVFDLAVDRKGCQGLSVNRRVFDGG